MRRTDSLFQLIKALNRADKRNFKLLTQLTAGDKNYTKLFDAIDRQQFYDEDKIIKQFKGENLVNQFSVAKNYLYNSILKSLTYFYKGENSEMTSLALQVKILVDKNLYPHAQKLLRKAKSKASKQENFYELLQLLEIERQIMIDRHEFKKFGIWYTEIQEQENDAKEKIDNYLAYRHLLDQVYKIITSSQAAREKSDIKNFRSLMSDPLLESEDRAISRRAKILYCIIKRWWGAYIYDYDIAEEFSGRAVEVFEESSDLCDVWIHRYIRVLFNFAQAQYVQGRFEASMATLDKMHGLKTRSEKAGVTKFEQYYHLKLVHVTNAGLVPDGMAVLSSFGAELRKVKGKMRKSMELNLYYYAALFCMVAGDYKEALKWSNSFLNEPRTEVRTDLQCSARLQNLLIHLELGNYDLIEHNLKSTYRFIFKRERMHAVERLVLRSIKQLYGTDEEEARQAVYQNMRTEIDELKKNRFELPAIQKLSLDLWVESKLRGISLGEARMEWFAKRRLQGAAKLPTVKS